MSSKTKRREFFRNFGAMALVALPGAGALAQSQQTQQLQKKEKTQIPSGQAQFVAADQDRTATPVVMGYSSLSFKVSGQQTNGGLFIMEHVGLTKGGGPPRHLHYEQEEWFYVMEGEVVTEVGEERFRLRKGDTVFAPRRLPHRFLYVAEKPGRLLIAFTPAGEMEAYFRDGHGFDPESFSRHGMEYVGPALTLEEAARVGG
jgi:quercetin dioxygenase-like cupin family protein